MKKYELTTECKEFLERKLYRIKALTSFSDVKEGDLGGWIEKEENLSQEGNAWVYGDAWVCDNASCFKGDIDEFEKQVQKVHGDNKHGRVYALAIAMAREQIELDDEDVEEEDE